MAVNPPDLDCLNAAEREALALLARGHTAKSIASLTGRSEGAINERLREARRKTGAGSSRELARLLRQQENWDEQIGVASREAVGADPASLAGGRYRLFRKVVAMIVLLAAAGALSLGISATLSPPQTTSSLPVDPLIDSVVGSPNATPQALHERFLAETRDPVWAPHSEAALTAAYRAIGELAPDLRIRCGSTLCEVAGRSMTGKSAALNRTMRALQSKILMTTLAAARLYPLSQSFGGPDKTGFAFVAFWTSVKP